MSWFGLGRIFGNRSANTTLLDSSSVSVGAEKTISARGKRRSRSAGSPPNQENTSLDLSCFRSPTRHELSRRSRSTFKATEDYLRELKESSLVPKKSCLKKKQDTSSVSLLEDMSHLSSATPHGSSLNESQSTTAGSAKKLEKTWHQSPLTPSRKRATQILVGKGKNDDILKTSEKIQPIEGSRTKRCLSKTPKYTDESFDERIEYSINKLNRPRPKPALSEKKNNSKNTASRKLAFPKTPAHPRKQKGRLNQTLPALNLVENLPPVSIPCKPRKNIAADMPPASIPRQPRKNIVADMPPASIPGKLRKNLAEDLPPVSIPCKPRKNIAADMPPASIPRQPKQNIVADMPPASIPGKPRKNLAEDLPPVSIPCKPRKNIAADMPPTSIPGKPKKNKIAVATPICRTTSTSLVDINKSVLNGDDSDAKSSSKPRNSSRKIPLREEPTCSSRGGRMRTRSSSTLNATFAVSSDFDTTVVSSSLNLSLPAINTTKKERVRKTLSKAVSVNVLSVCESVEENKTIPIKRGRPSKKITVECLKNSQPQSTSIDKPTVSETNAVSSTSSTTPTTQNEEVGVNQVPKSVTKKRRAASTNRKSSQSTLPTDRNVSTNHREIEQLPADTLVNVVVDSTMDKKDVTVQGKESVESSQMMNTRKRGNQKDCAVPNAKKCRIDQKKEANVTIACPATNMEEEPKSTGIVRRKSSFVSRAIEASTNLLGRRRRPSKNEDIELIGCQQVSSPRNTQRTTRKTKDDGAAGEVEDTVPLKTSLKKGQAKSSSALKIVPVTAPLERQNKSTVELKSDGRNRKEKTSKYILNDDKNSDPTCASGKKTLSSLELKRSRSAAKNIKYKDDFICEELRSECDGHKQGNSMEEIAEDVLDIPMVYNERAVDVFNERAIDCEFPPNTRVRPLRKCRVNGKTVETKTKLLKRTSPNNSLSMLDVL